MITRIVTPPRISRHSNAVSPRPWSGASPGCSTHLATPHPVDPELLRTVDLVVTLGRDTVVEVPAGVELRNWDTDEPSTTGIDGIERMRLVRDDIHARVHALLAELAPTTTTR